MEVFGFRRAFDGGRCDSGTFCWGSWRTGFLIPKWGAFGGGRGSERDTSMVERKELGGAREDSGDISRVTYCCC